MKVLQILPELNSGGVERGTLEVAQRLVSEGHKSLVISNGGRLVAELEAAGSRHIALPVHRKSLASLLQVRLLRSLIQREHPDIVHYRSRVPGWIAWLAWRGINPAMRPRLVSTVHGFYSVNAYSAVMTKGERVIAVSNSVRDYIIANYPKVDPAKIRVIHRGVSPEAFPRGYQPDAAWLERWHKEHPELAGRKLLLLPGRLTRWKGQEDFLHLIAALRQQHHNVHGLLAGETHPRKQAFGTELRELAASLCIADRISFLGHRPDVREVMAACDIVFSLSRDPEAFGRISLEAAALGKPVIGAEHGGVAEQLSVLFPQGLVPPGDGAFLAARTAELLEKSPSPAEVAAPFTLDAMTGATLGVYHELLAAPRHRSA